MTSSSVGLKKIVVKSCAAFEQQLDPVHLAKPTALGPMLEIELDLCRRRQVHSRGRVPGPGAGGPSSATGA